MAKRILTVTGKVFNIEIFYDLMFAYLISLLTNVMHDPDEGIFDVRTYLTYSVAFLSVLKVWFDTTLLLNRYGNNSVMDNVCMFTNMFFLYFMAEGFDGDHFTKYKVFILALLLIHANLIVHWHAKLRLYANLDEYDAKIINHTVLILSLQLAIFALGLVLPGDLGHWSVLVAPCLGISSWLFHDSYKLKPVNFAYLTERCWLLVIVMFGAALESVSFYLKSTTVVAMAGSLAVFLLLIGLFFIYGYQYEHLLDREGYIEHGTRYLALNALIVFILGNFTVAVDYLTRPETQLVAKTAYLTITLVAYLVTTYLISGYFRQGYETTGRNALSRIVACLAIVAASFATVIDPRLTIALDTTIVLVVAWRLWRFHVVNTDDGGMGAIVVTESDDD